MYLLNLARARSSPQFWHFNPEPNFPKNLPLFWDFHPEPNFPKHLPQFWDFSRLQTLGTFVLRFRYFEFTLCDCRSLEFTIGPTYFKLAGRGYECLFGAADFALEKGR